MKAEINIIIENRGIVTISNEGVKQSLGTDDKLSPEEFAFVACISQLLTKLENGKFIDYTFNVQDFTNDNEIVKCEWMPRSQNLKVRGITTRKIQHAESVDEALQRQRTFTCKRSLARMLPDNRKLKVKGE